jgi:hypothetical protein
MLQSKISLRRTARLAFLSLALVLALPALAIGALLWWIASRTWDHQERWSGIWLLAIPTCTTYALLLRFVHPPPVLLASFASNAWRSFLQLWGMNMLLSPCVALLLEALYPMNRRAHPPVCLSLPEGVDRKRSGTKFQPARPAALPVPLEPLGAYLGGDLCEWVFAHQLHLPLEALWRHGVVIGEPGYGKTITLLRLATIAVQNGMQVIFLDLKGSPKSATQFVAAMRQAGVRRVKTFPGEAYDGWRGDATALYNRLMAMIDPGTHPYYYRLTSALVSLAVHAPPGPPRSSRDFLLRLEIGTRKQPGWLMRAYADPRYWYEVRKLEKLRPHIQNLSLAYDGFFDGVAAGLDGKFAFEDAEAIFIGLDGDVLKEQAAGMGRYLLQDAAHYAKQRKPRDRHVLLIIDEFGVLKTSNATDLYERMREAGMSIWSSAQSYQALGGERANILASASIKILHRCGSPEELVKFAGQRESAAFSLITEDEESTPEFARPRLPRRRTAVRMQRQYAVPLEDIQQLAVGKIVVISGGLYAVALVHPLVQGEDPSLNPEPFLDPQVEAPLTIQKPPQVTPQLCNEWGEDESPVDFFS